MNEDLFHIKPGSIRAAAVCFSDKAGLMSAGVCEEVMKELLPGGFYHMSEKPSGISVKNMTPNEVMFHRRLLPKHLQQGRMLQ